MKQFTQKYKDAVKKYLKDNKLKAYQFAIANKINPQTWYKNFSGIAGVDIGNDAWIRVAKTVGVELHEVFEDAF